MNGKLPTYFYILISGLFIVYIISPISNFPDPGTDFLQSNEPADVESQLRRAYFTDMTRQEVIDHYQDKYRNDFLGVDVPNIRLNYPPEEAVTIIRDQTRSTFLEELVHPFKSSVYINGFEPKLEKDRIFIDDKEWKQKITVRYVPSNTGPRFILSIIIVAIIPLVWNELYKLIRKYLFVSTRFFRSVPKNTKNE